MNLLLAIATILIALCIVAAVAVRAIGGNITLVDDWKSAWRYYSTWGWLVVAMLPEVWNALITGGYLNADDVPDQFSFYTKIGLAAVFALKMIQQVKRPKLPDFGAVDKQAGG